MYTCYVIFHFVLGQINLSAQSDDSISAFTQEEQLAAVLTGKTPLSVQSLMALMDDEVQRPRTSQTSIFKSSHSGKNIY